VTHGQPAAADRRSYRWLISAGLLTGTIAAAFLALPALAGVPARLIQGCGRWILAAAALELLSAVGFVIFFKLVFADPISWRHTVAPALRALGASAILPAGGLIGPTLGAWSATREKPSASNLARATITFAILTSVPGAIVIVAVGMSLWLGLASGPRAAVLTVLPAALALGLLTVTWVGAGRCRSRPSPRRRAHRCRALAGSAESLGHGLGEARTLVLARNWKLGGAIAYYALDNAVLWAAFHAYGHVPPVGVVGMGYLIGSIAGALPLPAGLGALDGGLIGALVLYGAPVAPAAAAVLLYRGISILVSVVLGAIGLTSRPRSQQRTPVRAHRSHSRPAHRVAPARLDRT
jgi:uncharacterized membrane protein YbhN (UPF0104 family)